MATTIAAKRKLSSLYPEERLPESDGKPMAETDPHRKLMVNLLDELEEYFRDDANVYVTGNIFLYYRDEVNERQSVSPDIFVVRGVKKKERRYYNLDVERKAPDMVIELTSSKTKTEDLGTKRFIYANLGVREYFLFDPDEEAIRPALRGFRLEKGEYAPMVGTRLESKVLGLQLSAEGGWLRLYDLKTGERLRTHQESEAERRLAEKKAAQMSKAYREAEAEIMRLREEVAKLRKK